MDVAILGTGERARQFARLFVTDASDRRDNSESTSPTLSLYGEEATAVMDAIDAIEEDLRNRGVSHPESSADRIDRTTDLDRAVTDATLVVETREDTLETVRDTVATVERHVSTATVIAFPVGEKGATAVAVALEHPDRGVGIETVAKREPGVLEVVRADQTNDSTVETVQRFADAIGWGAVVVNDAPGMISRRLQLALEVEAMRAVETDVATPAAIDSIMHSGFDHAEGPLASADRAGLDDRLQTLEVLAEKLGERFDPPAVLRAKVDAGDLGVKTGAGFHVWDDGTPVDSGTTGELQ